MQSLAFIFKWSSLWHVYIRQHHAPRWLADPIIGGGRRWRWCHSMVTWSHVGASQDHGGGRDGGQYRVRWNVAEEAVGRRSSRVLSLLAAGSWNKRKLMSPHWFTTTDLAYLNTLPLIKIFRFVYKLLLIVMQPKWLSDPTDAHVPRISVTAFCCHLAVRFISNLFLC